MRNLIICLDGTWNTPDQKDRGRQVPSNVVKMARAIKQGRVSPELEQVVYYDTGVGTGGALDKFIGGMTGQGIMKNILQAYRWLVETYQDGDRIYMFGFSRGAFTARSLAGLVGVCGIPALPEGQEAQDKLIADAKTAYRTKDKAERTALADIFKAAYQPRPGKVHFIGVWDTVGALGVPTTGPVGWWTRKRSGFHDVTLGTHVSHAYHAVAINERRGPFKPTLWSPDNLAEGQTLLQAWFPGVHSNVGGGYADSGLSDRALLWMINSGYERGLKFDGTYVELRINPNWFGELRDSSSLMYKVMVWDKMKDRTIGTADPETEVLHISADGRWKHASAPETPPANYTDAKAKPVKVFKAKDWEAGFNSR